MDPIPSPIAPDTTTPRTQRGMTFRAEVPRRANRRTWTAYERARDGVGFDYDACSDLTDTSIWPGTIEDVEDLTILQGLESVSSESDVSS